jgi:hypothetical protein
VAKRTDDSVSTPALIKALEEGETFSKCRRVAVGSKEARNLTDVLNQIRNRVNTGVSRIRKEVPGSNFRVESGIALTDDKLAHLCTVAVTRMDADNSDVDI